MYLFGWRVGAWVLGWNLLCWWKVWKVWGAMGVAGTVDWLEAGVEVLEKTGWHILVSTPGVLVVDVVEIYCMPVWIMKVSMMFKI